MVIKNKSSLMFFLLVIVSFSLLIYFVFKSSLHLSLWGDDWEMLWIIKNYYGPGNQFPYLALKGYAQPWGVMNLFLIINKHFFEYSAYGYYFVSMVLRLLSALAGYLFLTKFNKSKFIGLIGGLFVLIGYTGIESTNYTIHMNTYLVPMFMFLTLITLIDSYKNRLWKFLLGCFLFALSLAASPLRSHGLLPFVVIFDILFGLTIAKVNWKKILFRQVFLFLSFLVIYKLKFFGTPTEFINLAAIVQMIKDGNYTFISCFITTLGRAYFPDIFLTGMNSLVTIFGLDWFRTVAIISFLVESLLFWYFAIITKQKIKSYIVALSALALNFSIIALIFNKFRYESWLNSLAISTFIGIFFLSFLFWAFYTLFKSKKEDDRIGWLGIIAGPTLILTSLLVPLFHNVGGSLESNYRYLTLGMSGVAITFSAMLKLSMASRKGVFLISSLLVILIMTNIAADKSYFTNLYLRRSPQLEDSMWNQFNGYMKKYFQSYPNKLLLFYLEDKDAGGIADNIFHYGFGLRIALENNINDQSILPISTNIYDEIVSAATDGKSFLRLGYPQKKIDINQIYAFKITKTGELLDITESVRKKVSTESNTHE
jgi:hypothetical protein